MARKASALARYNVDGSLDTSFSLNGKARTRFVDRTLRESATDVAIQADGGILVSGVACDANGCNLVLARYLPDGSLDAFFGTGGAAITPISWYTVGDLAVQADGKIVVGAGHSLFRYDPNGSFDTSFSDDGWVRTAVAADGVGIQSDGKIVVAGPTRWEPRTFAVARFDPSGALDRTFGGGRATTDFPGFDDLAYALAIQADGKIVSRGDDERLQHRQEIRPRALPGELTRSHLASGEPPCENPSPDASRTQGARSVRLACPLGGGDHPGPAGSRATPRRVASSLRASPT